MAISARELDLQLAVIKEDAHRVLTRSSSWLLIPALFSSGKASLRSVSSLKLNLLLYLRQAEKD